MYLAHEGFSDVRSCRECKLGRERSARTSPTLDLRMKFRRDLAAGMVERWHDCFSPASPWVCQLVDGLARRSGRSH